MFGGVLPVAFCELDFVSHCRYRLLALRFVLYFLCGFLALCVGYHLVFAVLYVVRCIPLYVLCRIFCIVVCFVWYGLVCVVCCVSYLVCVVWHVERLVLSVSFYCGLPFLLLHVLSFVVRHGICSAVFMVCIAWYGMVFTVIYVVY